MWIFMNNVVNVILNIWLYVSNQQALSRHGVELCNRLLSPRCVALGEVGLDYQSDMTDGQKQSQRDTLSALVRLRPAWMPIVVHCRGVRPSTIAWLSCNVESSPTPCQCKCTVSWAVKGMSTDMPARVTGRLLTASVWTNFSLSQTPLTWVALPRY